LFPQESEGKALAEVVNSTGVNDVQRGISREPDSRQDEGEGGIHAESRGNPEIISRSDPAQFYGNRFLVGPAKKREREGGDEELKAICEAGRRKDDKRGLAAFFVGGVIFEAVVVEGLGISEEAGLKGVVPPFGVSDVGEGIFPVDIGA
jgi:hypothetical protein